MHLERQSYKAVKGDQFSVGLRAPRALLLVIIFAEIPLSWNGIHFFGKSLYLLWFDVSQCHLDSAPDVNKSVRNK